MSECSYCYESIPDDLADCPSCGQERHIDTSDLTCQDCGTDISHDTTGLGTGYCGDCYDSELHDPVFDEDDEDEIEDDDYDEWLRNQ